MPETKTGSGDKAQPVSVYKAERMLLNLMFFSSAAFRIVKAELTKEELTDAKNQELFRAISLFKENEEGASTPVFLSSLPDELKSLAADILLQEYTGILLHR